MIKGLYFHIPFCKSVCTYCDFVKGVFSDNVKENYFKALIKEFNNNTCDLSEVETLFIGGGTPSSINISLLSDLMDNIYLKVNKNNLKEITIECNLNDINFEFINFLNKYGINRVSIGIESFDKKTLKKMGRNHTYLDALAKVNLLKENNITNINIDMIYGFPGETYNNVLENLNCLLSLDIKHISYYEIILEDKTILNYKIKNNLYKLTSESKLLKIQNLIKTTLKDNGFNRYEISNYAKTGFESKHNLLYWNMDEYLGFGANSHSLVNDNRFYNEENIIKYIYDVLEDKDIKKFEECNLLSEYFIMGLRKISGVNILDINNLFKIDVLTKYPKIKYYIELGFMKLNDGYLSFTDKGFDVSNKILEIFI